MYSSNVYDRGNLLECGNNKLLLRLLLLGFGTNRDADVTNNLFLLCVLMQPPPNACNRRGVIEFQDVKQLKQIFPTVLQKPGPNTMTVMRGGLIRKPPKSTA